MILRMERMTRRMRLLPATAETVRAEIAHLAAADAPAADGTRAIGAGTAALAEALGADIPDNWPPELLRHALPFFLKQLEEKPERAEWMAWYGLVRGDEGWTLA